MAASAVYSQFIVCFSHALLSMRHISWTAACLLCVCSGVCVTFVCLQAHTSTYIVLNSDNFNLIYDYESMTIDYAGYGYMNDVSLFIAHQGFFCCLLFNNTFLFSCLSSSAVVGI